MNKPVKPTEKQKKFVHNKLKGMSNRAAALAAGYSENTASDATSDILEKPGTIAYLRDCMRRAGIKEEDLSQVLLDGLTAEKSDITGDVHPDHKTRLEFVKYINDMLGYIAPKKLEHTGENGSPIGLTINNFKDLSDEELQKLIGDTSRSS